MKKIAIILTTFCRNELALKTIDTILNNWDDRYVLLVGDQNKEANIFGQFIAHCINYYHLPFDCGLSEARNFLVKKAQELECDYCLVMADSIQFKKPLDLDPIINFLEKEPNRGLVGLKLENRISWEFNMDMKPGICFVLTPPTEQIEEDDIKYTKCEICKNFFLAKTKVLLENPWDSELKLSEHEDFFWRLKINTPYKVFFTEHVKGIYVDEKPTEYIIYRNRMYHEFRKKLQDKYKINAWIEKK